MAASNKEYIDRTSKAAEDIEKGQGRTIVAAVDESEFAESVFKFVADHYNTADTKVVFVYVARPFDSLFSSTFPTSKKPSEVEEKKPMVEKWVHKAAELQLSFTAEGIVLTGDVREQLVLFCDKLKPDALAMGSHGMGAVKRVLIGSVSNYCVQHSACPVVVVRKPKEEPAKGAQGPLGFLKTVTKRFKKEKHEKEHEGEQKGEVGGETVAVPVATEEAAPAVEGASAAEAPRVEAKVETSGHEQHPQPAETAARMEVASVITSAA